MFDQVGELESVHNVISMSRINGRLTLKIGHKGLSTRVQSVDDHLPVGRAGNLNSVSLLSSNPF